MNRKNLVGFSVAATLFLSVSLVGSGNALRKGISSTRRVVIDGRSLVSDDSTSDDGSFLKREFEHLGVHLPDDIQPAEDRGTSHPAFSGRLKDSPLQIAIAIPRLPTGLTTEHTIRMEGDKRTVDLIFGSVRTPGPSIRSRLLSSGWKSVSTGNDSVRFHVLQTTKGKETSIVCLDEADSTFLLFREVGR
jgi:hypothetical protein